MDNFANQETRAIDRDGNPQQACSDFESRLRSGQNPLIEEYLKSTNGPKRSTVLSRLILIELRYRFLSGEHPSIEEYIRRFPAEAEPIRALEPYLLRIQNEVRRATAVTAIHAQGQMLGRFELLDKLGKGGFGEVWRAWDPQLRRTVAVKTIDPQRIHHSDINLAQHEAKIAAQLSHPNIVRVYEFHESETSAFIVSEFIEGLTLRDALILGQFDCRQIADICRQIALALEAAHHHGIVHRDIKPSNILITLEGTPKLADFGIAHWSNAEKTLRDRGDVVGTANYMSPEQAQGKKVMPQSDVYALGVVLYEMLTGRLPFVGEIRDVLVAHQFRTPANPRRFNARVSKDFEKVCLKALEKRPRDRYSTAAEFSADLNRISNRMPVSARRIGPIARFIRSIRRSRERQVTTVVFLLAFTSVAAFASYLAFYAPNGQSTNQYSVVVTSEPPHATVAIWPVDPDTQFVSGDFGIADKRTKPLRLPNVTPESIKLSSGFYKLHFWNEDGSFVEAFRTVPEDLDSIPPPRYPFFWQRMGDNELAWKPVRFLSKDPFHEEMVYIPGCSDFPLEIPDFMSGKRDAIQVVTIAPFWVATHEFSLKDYQEIRGTKLVYHKDESDLGHFATARFDQAMQWAEEANARLPYELEFEYLRQLTQDSADNDYQRIDKAVSEFQMERNDLLNSLAKIQGITNGPAEWVLGHPQFFDFITGKLEQVDMQEPSQQVLRGGTLDFEQPEAGVVQPGLSRYVLRYDSRRSGSSFRIARTAHSGEQARDQD